LHQFPHPSYLIEGTQPNLPKTKANIFRELRVFISRGFGHCSSLLHFKGLEAVRRKQEGLSWKMDENGDHCQPFLGFTMRGNEESFDCEDAARSPRITQD